MQKNLKFTLRQMKPLFRLDLKKPRNQMFKFRREMDYMFLVIRLTLVVVDQLFFVFAFPWKPLSYEVINAYSQGKRVVFC